VKTLRRFLYGSEIVLGCLGIVGLLISSVSFFAIPFHAHETELGYWFLLLVPYLILYALASIPAIVLGLCGVVEYRILAGRVEPVVAAKAAIQCALVVILGGFILIYPYSANSPIPGLQTYSSRELSGLHLLVFLWASTFMTFLYLPSIVKLAAITVVWTHLIVNAFDAYAAVAKVNARWAAFAASVFALAAVLPVVLVSVSRQMVPPQTLSAGDYFSNSENLGLARGFSVRDLAWDDETKDFDAAAALRIVINDAHTPEGVTVRIAFFSSREKATARYDNDLQQWREYATSRGLLDRIGSMSLGDRAWLRDVRRPQQLELQDGKVVLAAYWHMRQEGPIPAYVLEIVRTLAASARQDFVR
jgi:hypothetical protein